MENTKAMHNFITLIFKFQFEKKKIFYLLIFIRNTGFRNTVFNQEYKRGQAAQTH